MYAFRLAWEHEIYLPLVVREGVAGRVRGGTVLLPVCPECNRLNSRGAIACAICGASFRPDLKAHSAKPIGLHKWGYQPAVADGQTTR